ncbi:zinc finger protein Dzip1-like isoform X4 [Scyliorhinus canicula]|uniref:zinc finger protein Dzip1-like isoform X4 n=1 Tax=Scyliorhinus canicula TaxID=7830 RepID=UPI0018F29B4B|nr:zinc finger protein Dzip1-like isoform X4 [Scyliorhinus canicula]
MWLTGISAVPHNSLSDTTLPSSLTASVRGGQTPLFKFRKRHETINWRRISAIDVDRVANELDFATLQENIMSITFCNLDPEKCPYCQNQLDPTLLKMFKLAQLTIEYLLHSQEYLTSNLQMYEEKLRTSEFGNKELKKELSQLADEMKSQKEECKRRKQIISTQQLMIQSGANNYHKCQYCEKTFMNSFFMQSHIQRRHPNQTDVEKKNYQSDKIQGEIDQLKKQLQKTQSQLEAEKLLYSKTHSQEQKWTSEISSVFERHDNEKQKIQLDIESLMSSITKNQKESSSYYKKKIKELGRKLHNQHQLITEETEEVKACPIKPPKKILESSLVAATPLRQKSLRLEQPVAKCKLEPIKELNEENEDMKHLPEVSTCNEDLRKVLIKNPKIVKELHKIVEQSLAEKLETLGIKPGVQGISGGQLTRILDTVDSDREEKIKAFPDFYLFRESLSRKVEDKIKGREDSLCHLKNKFIKSTIEKSENNLSKISQPSCSKICKKKVSSPKLSSTTLSSTSSGSGESIGNLSLDTSTSTESSKNEMSETCELEEVCVIEEQKSTENNSAGPKSVEKGLTESIEEELSRRVNARAAKSQQSQKKKVSRELKFIKEKKYDVWEVSSVEDDQCLLPKTEKGRDSSTVAKTGETHSARGINVLSKSSEKATN